MTVDAKAILTQDPPPIDVMNFLNKLDHVKNVSVTPSGTDYFIYIKFEWHGEKRNMAVFFNGNCKSDYESVYPHNAALVSIGKWGMSDAIIMALVNEFDGFYMLNDCTDDWSSKQ